VIADPLTTPGAVHFNETIVALLPVTLSPVTCAGVSATKTGADDADQSLVPDALIAATWNTYVEPVVKADATYEVVVPPVLMVFDQVEPAFDEYLTW